MKGLIGLELRFCWTEGFFNTYATINAITIKSRVRALSFLCGDLYFAVSSGIASFGGPFWVVNATLYFMAIIIPSTLLQESLLYLILYEVYISSPRLYRDENCSINRTMGYPCGELRMSPKNFFFVLGRGVACGYEVQAQVRHLCLILQAFTTVDVDSYDAHMAYTQ